MGTNYFADIIELKTGIKTRLGNASTGNPSTGNPSSVMKMGVDNGNSGIADYNLGLSRSSIEIIGYTVGDIKFFALTMRDDTEPNYTVTNFF
jgi:hypothetical protein